MAKKEKRQPNPYEDAVSSHNSVFDRLVRNARMGWVFGMIGIIAGVAGWGYAVKVSADVKAVPYIVEIDDDGVALRIRGAERTYQASDDIKRAFIARSIKYLRSVTADSQVQQERIGELYKTISIGSPAKSKIDEYFTNNSPFYRAASELVSVQIIGVLSLSESTYRVEWLEVVRDRTGTIQERKQYEAAVSYITSEAKTTQEVLNNPIGLKLTDIVIEEKLNQ